MGRCERTFTTTNGVNTFTRRDDDEAWGYQLGGGVEMAASDTWSVGVEYLYTSLDDDEYRVRTSGPAPATNPFILVNPAGTDFARSEDAFDHSSVRFTASYRFAL